MSTDTTIIECAGCSAVLYSQKQTMEPYTHYDSRTGDLWHLPCWEAHKKFMESI
jgi:hypothetical protein